MKKDTERRNSTVPAGRRYEKPRLRRIKLEAGEVLAKGCKMEAAGSNFGQQVGCLAPSTCVDTGS